MSLKRRQFLLFSGFSALAAFVSAGKSFSRQINPNFAKKDLLLRFVSVADTGTGARGQYNVAQAMTSYHSKNPTI
jgi:hypothetical protein